MRPWLIVALVVGVGYLVARKALPEQIGSVEEAVAEGIRYVYASTIESRENEEKFSPAIAEVEQRYGIPDGLLHRQLYQESHYRSDIIGQYPDGTPVPKLGVSSAGAVGIAQIVPRWHPGVDPRDPLASIEYAGRYMVQLYRQLGSWSAALAGYNWGPGNVQKHLAQYGELNLAALPPETRDYVSQITSDVGVA